MLVGIIIDLLQPDFELLHWLRRSIQRELTSIPNQFQIMKTKVELISTFPLYEPMNHIRLNQSS